MAFCTACGRQRSGSGRFCTACGASFPEVPSSGATVAPGPAVRPSAPVSASHPATMTAHADPGGVAAPGRTVTPAFESPPGPPPGGRRNTVVAVVAAAAVLLAGGATVAWLTYGNHKNTGGSQGQAAHGGTSSRSVSKPSVQSTASLSATQAPSPTLSPSLSPSLSPTPSATPNVSGSLVTLAPGIVQDSETSQVEAFVSAYFIAINEHSFQKYLALLDPVMQQHETAQSFHAGYRTTVDSNATITAISTVSPGLVGATVTFVSHQQPSGSATGTACTDWNITLYLRKIGGHYVLGHAPPGYQAAFAAC